MAVLGAQDCPFRLVAGPPVGGMLEGVAANQAWLQGPSGTSIDATGNLYIAATYDNSILRVGTDNIIHVIAGTGVSGSAGDGGSAIQAQLAQPIFVLAAPDGTVYISDTGNNRIRRLMLDGTIVAVAGTGHPGFSGDGGSALSAEFSGPTGLAFDATGNLYIADTQNSRIRKVSANGTITTVAGTDPSCSTCLYTGDGGQATAATLSGPGGLAVGQDGSMYIADLGNNVVRRVGPDGVIETIAGGGQSDTYPVAALSAYLGFPGNVILEGDGSLLIGGGPILKLSADGSTVSLISNGPSDGYVSQDSQGRIYAGGPLGDDVIARTSGSSTLIQPVVGQFHFGKGPEGGSAIGAVVNDPQGMAVAPDGTVYVADRGNQRVAKISTGGTISTFATISDPLSIAIGPSGAVYVVDGGLLVRRIAPDGTTSVFAGNGRSPQSIVQPPKVGQPAVAATSISLEATYGIAIDSSENVYLEINCPDGVIGCEPDSGGFTSLVDIIVKVTPNGQLTTIYAPNPIEQVNAGGAINVITDFHGLALDAAGNLLVGTDSGLIEIDLAGKPTGSTFPNQYGQSLFSGSEFTVGGAGADLAASAAGGVFVTGDLVSAGDYLAEGYQVQQLAPGRFQTIYNDGFTDYQGAVNVVDPPLPQAQLATDSQGNLYVSEKYLHRIRMVPAGSCPATAAPVIAAATSASTPSKYQQTFAPGELITFYGSSMGPASGVGPMLNANGLAATNLAGVQVLFNGIPGPILYASATQVNAIIPFTSYGVTAVRVQLAYNGAVSNSWFIQMADVAPGLFPVVVNSDGTVNSQANPAVGGSVVILYGTGFGRTTPAGIDGHLASAPYPAPILPVTVQNDSGVFVSPAYAGDAPGIVEGVTQINVVVPNTHSPWAAELQIGNALASSITIFIK